MTVETRGIPLAVFVARVFNIPVVMARRVGQITEGSTVSINYVSGSSKQIQTMALPKRALPSSARVLVIDDFMRPAVRHVEWQNWRKRLVPKL